MGSAVFVGAVTGAELGAGWRLICIGLGWSSTNGFRCRPMAGQSKSAWNGAPPGHPVGLTTAGAALDPDNAWRRTIVYRNLRHHAATKWFHEALGESWEVLAHYLGDKLTTVLNHYVRAGEDALRDSVSKFADL